MNVRPLIAALLVAALSAWVWVPVQGIRGEGMPAPVSWRSEGLQGWGEGQLAVDFGPRGLWNYDGFWVRLSYWDPMAMAVWGGGRLAVDFGANGLWSYDGVSWIRLSGRAS